MQEILLAVLALGGVAAIAFPLLLARRGPGPVTISGERLALEASEEWKRRQAERNRRRVDRQAQHADWQRKFNALLPPPPEPEGEPLAVIRAWDGTIVGKIWDQPEPENSWGGHLIRKPPVPTNSDPFNLLEDLQRQRNWKP